MSNTNSIPKTLEAAQEIKNIQAISTFVFYVKERGESFTQAWERVKEEMGWTVANKAREIMSYRCVEAGNAALASVNG